MPELDALKFPLSVQFRSLRFDAHRTSDAGEEKKWSALIKTRIPSVAYTPARVT